MSNSITMRYASPEDLEMIVSIFNSAIQLMNDNGINQWDDQYPNEEVLQNDIINHQMFVVEIENQIAAAFVLNQECDLEYENGDWQYKDASFYVVHRLCVNPLYQGKGIGSITMQLIEDYLRKQGIETIRLDTFSLNVVALKLYEKLGYKRVGVVTWRKGVFYLYEKKI